MNGTGAAPEVSIVIPTYRRRDLIETCLESVAGLSGPAREVIVVDDGGGDDTGAYVRAQHPAVRLIALERNGGFVRAANAGIAAARGAWVLLLNNDMTLAPDALARMLDAAARTDAAMIAPLILWRDEPDRVYSAGDGMTRGLRPEPLGFRERRAELRVPEAVFGVTGGAGLFHRTVFERVGLLAPSFGAYFEDADLCFRARLAGFHAALAADAVAWHVGSASLGGRAWWRSAQCYRNHALLVIRNAPLGLLFRCAMPILREHLHQAGRVWSSGRDALGAAGAAWLLLRTAGSLAIRVPGALWARVWIQRMRVADARAVAAWLLPDAEK